MLMSGINKLQYKELDDIYPYKNWDQSFVPEVINWKGNREAKEDNVSWCQRPIQSGIMLMTHKHTCDLQRS